MPDPVFDLKRTKKTFPVLKFTFVRPQTHKIDVQVLDVDGTPVERDVIAINRLTKAVSAIGRSDPVTGRITLNASYAEVAVLALAENSSNLPDLVVRVIPTPV